MYAKVLVEIGVKNVDKYFTYKIKEELVPKIKIGIRVKIPFNNRIIEGFVISLFDHVEDSSYDIKEIKDIVDEEEVLNEEMLELGTFIANKTLCSMVSAYQVMLPKALKANSKVNMQIKTNKYADLNIEEESVNEYIKKCKYSKQINILKEIIQLGKVKITSLNSSSIKSLVNKNILKEIEEEVYRYETINMNKEQKINLNEEQKYVINEITNNLNSDNIYLLHGVTGSGKTEVYMNIIEEVIKKNKEAIMLVPEISLTPQIVSRFKQRFNNDVAVLHSGLSDGERYDEYRKIKQGLVKIVVGARSAIFSPFKNLGIIIIDEEHVTSYKQDSNPRYHTKDIAIYRNKYHKCPLVLGSATPSLESYARAKKGVYKLLELTKRANQQLLPEVSIIDMQTEVKTNSSYLSNSLTTEIAKRLNKKEQVIILLNRRGYSSMITCKNCGNVIKCPNCDISLTYHKTSDTLRCHYCGYGEKRSDKCNVCGSENVKDYGIGTEKLEEELKKIFNANVVRMDLDTTSTKNSYQNIINDFLNNKYDILVGTQMIAKGLDFPNVTLVGVLNADSSLNIPDFRSSEYTFQLLSQVSGRAGRANKEGKVIIQTLNPTHYSITYAKNHNYIDFYNYEMSLRKKLGYPPYYYLILVKILSKNYQEGFENANKIGNYLRKNLNQDTTILGPSIANILKINNIYHFQCIIKYKKDDNLNKTLHELDELYKINNNVKIEIDIDPLKL